MPKPEDQFKCRACLKIWTGEEVMHDPFRPGRYVCGDITCAGVVDKLKGRE